MIIPHKPNLVIVPVGQAVSTDDHYRWLTDDRNYEVIAVQYGDFEPEKNTYDYLFKIKGQKWEIVKELYTRFDFTEWEYVGFFDDDVILSSIDLTKAFDIAKEYNFKGFQISLTHDSEYSRQSTVNIPGATYATTNFIEIMCPVFNREMTEKFMVLLNSTDVKTGWGIDFVLSEYLETDFSVIHEVQMKHPARQQGSTYDKSNATAEMQRFLSVVYPTIMKENNRSYTNYSLGFEDKTLTVVL